MPKKEVAQWHLRQCQVSGFKYHHKYTIQQKTQRRLQNRGEGQAPIYRWVSWISGFACSGTHGTHPE
jgi:hypothetical protein